MQEEQAPARPALERWKELINRLPPDQIVDLPDLPDNQVKRMMAGLPQDKLTPLLEEQYEAARTESRARWQEFLAGRGTLSALFSAFHELLQAELDLSDTRSDRVASLEAQLLRMQLVEFVEDNRFNAGRISIMDREQSRFQRIRAQIVLERAKTGRRVPDQEN